LDYVDVNDFVSYTLEDLGVVIPHSSRMPNRWAWFWPQYLANTPTEVVRNTVVVYHNRDGLTMRIPPDVEAVTNRARLVLVNREGHSIVWPTLAGLEAIKTRLVARIANDVEIVNPNWVGLAIDLFNQPPHLKILAKVVDPGPGFEKIEQVARDFDWLLELLHLGAYDGMSYIHGSVIITNRAVWIAYYADLVPNYTIHDGEDIYFTLFSRADGIPVIQFSENFEHRGPSNQDVIL